MAGIAAATTEGTGQGLWSNAEKSQFFEGIIAHGWGKWSTIQQLLPTRSRTQIKSHAQKYLKHHPDKCHDLIQEHEECTAASESSVAKKIQKKKATPRRRGRLSKAKTPSDRVIASPRPRRCSSPGNISLKESGSHAVERCGDLRARKVSSPVKTILKRKTPKKTTARKSWQLSPQSMLAEITPSVSRVTLTSPSTISARSVDFRSPRADHCAVPTALNQNPPEKDDELIAMAAMATPSPFSKPAHRNLSVEANDVDGLIENLSLTCLTKLGGNEEEIFDPLLHLEVNDNNLDMISDFLSPSWNVMLDDKDSISMMDDDFLTPIALNGGSGGMGVPLDGMDIPCIEDRHEKLLIPSLVCPDLEVFMYLRTQLTSPADFNNPKECVLAEDGLSWIGAETGVLFRARIKNILEDQLGMGWWRGDAFQIGSLAATSHSAGVGMVQSAIVTSENEVDEKEKEGDIGGLFAEDSFKKFALERLIALAAVMLDVDHWHTRRHVQQTSYTTTCSQSFNDEDDIRHIGQLLSGLWERVSRFLLRDDVSLLGGDSVAKMERHEAINKMVGMLDTVSRQGYSQSLQVSMVSV